MNANDRLLHVVIVAAAICFAFGFAGLGVALLFVPFGEAAGLSILACCYGGYWCYANRALVRRAVSDAIREMRGDE